jgi:hypothetical protein
MADLGYLHAFYYQTLRNCQTPPKNPRGYSSFESTLTAAIIEALSAVQKRH